jgi:hypothetical protein
VECVMACTSLHHVADLDDVLDRVGAVLVPGGAVVVVEWAWERFDEATARWCFARLARAFARLARATAAAEPGWLPGRADCLGGHAGLRRAVHKARKGRAV